MKITAELDELGNVTFDESMYCKHCKGIRASFQEVAVLASLFGQSIREVGACECHKSVVVKFNLYTGPDEQTEFELAEEHICPFCDGLKFDKRQALALETRIKNTDNIFKECTCVFGGQSDAKDN